MTSVSIITVVKNGASTIRDCIKSVINQTYPVEYIIIDGCSYDGTVEIANEYIPKISTIISEPDNGIYDAMNKGIKLATGDVVGVINADDFYVDNDVISTVVNEFDKKNVDSIFADLVIVNRNDTSKVLRYYKSLSFYPRKFSYGWMPAHPTFFVKRFFYDKYGLFKTDYKIAADYELLARLIGKHRITYSYIPRVLIKMRAGGISTKNIQSNITLNKEILRACAENGIKTNIFKIYLKYFEKIFQLFDRPK